MTTIVFEFANRKDANNFIKEIKKLGYIKEEIE